VYPGEEVEYETGGLAQGTVPVGPCPAVEFINPGCLGHGVNKTGPASTTLKNSGTLAEDLIDGGDGDHFIL